MKITDQQLCIGGLLILATGALAVIAFTEKDVNSLMAVVVGVTSGLLGYLKGKKDSEE